MPCAKESLRVGARFNKDGVEALVTVVLYEELYMKDADAANWSAAVMYRSDEDNTKMQVRSVEDFCNKFTLEEED